MAKKVISALLSITLVLLLTTTAFASSSVAEVENAAYLTNTDPNEISPLGSEVFYDTYYVGAGSSLNVYSADSSNGYFTSTPGTSCVLYFSASTNQIGVVRITIGGVSYSLSAIPISTSNGITRFYVPWVNDTATPYMIQITNYSSSQITITAMSISY